MSPSYLLQEFAPGVIAAALVAFAIAMLSRWLPARSAKQAALATSVGVGYAAGHIKGLGFPAFPPGDATHWLLFSALLAVPLGVGYGICRNRWARLAITLALLVATLALLLMPKLKQVWAPGVGAAWLGGLSFAGVCLGWALDEGTRTGTRRLSLLWFLVITFGATIALCISGSLMLGQLAAILSSSVFAVIAASALGSYVERAVAPCLATLFTGLVACGYFYAELPWSSALLLTIAPLTSLVIRGETTLRHELLRAAIVAVPVTAAVVLAFRASPPVEYY